MRTLPAHRKAASVAQSSIRPDLHKPFDIHRNRLAQVALNHPVPLDYIPDAHDLVFGQVLNFCINVNTGFLAYIRSPTLADSKNVSQTDLNPLIQRQIHSRDSSQFLPPP
jgi:hypothetical protein